MDNYVLITGATSGIGYEFCEIFAQNKYNLIITGRDNIKLHKMKSNLNNKYGIDVYSFSKDLSTCQGAYELYEEVKCRNLTVDILINNAGFGYVGEFVSENIEKDEKMIALNIKSLTVLTKLFSSEMVKRKYGKILNVSSTGGYHPGPYTSVYYATKAYVLSFTEALYYELKQHNITVSVLCPGATKTNFSKIAGKKDNDKARSAKSVAQYAYKKFMKGKKKIIPGIENKLLVCIPRNIAAPFIGKYQRKLKNN